MRKLLHLAVILCCSIGIQAQSWYTVSAITGQRSGALGFAIDGYGYCGMGRNAANLFDLWKYDPMSDSWSQVSTPPNGFRVGGFSFVVDSFAYIGLGNLSTDCWKYNGYQNQWFPIDSFPSAPRTSPACFQIGNYGYVGTGSGRRDFWRYDVAADSWTQIDSLPGLGRKEATSFAINGVGYVGLGGDGSGWNALNDFWKYDTVNGWIALNPFPGTAREGAIGLTLLGHGYVCGGGGYMWSFSNELWEYDPSFDYWMTTTSLPATQRKLMTGFVIDSTAYFGTGTFYGFDPPTYYLNDFHAFSFSIMMNVREEDRMDFTVTVVHGDFIFINSAKDINSAIVHLYSIDGKEICAKEISGTHCRLATSGLAEGIYLVLIETPQNQFTQKVVLH